MGVEGPRPGLGCRATSGKVRALSPCPDWEGAWPEQVRAQIGVEGRVGRLPHWEGASLREQGDGQAEEGGPGSRWVPVPSQRDWECGHQAATKWYLEQIHQGR